MDEVNARERILDRAQHLVAEEGVKRLTIENVAVAAKVSRGGVLYHFPSKDALIQSMLDRLTTRFETILESLVANDPDSQGRWTRAFARATLQMDEDTKAAFTPLLAAIAYEPELLTPLRERMARWEQRMDAELDPLTAQIIRLAAHALWLNELFGFNHFDTHSKRAIVDRLVEMSRRSGSS